MSIKPILFNTEMVRANLDGRKKNTRRLVKPQPDIDGLVRFDAVSFVDTDARIYKPPYQTGDILYVRETWSPVFVYPKRYIYKADSDNGIGEGAGLPIRWRPSIHMPKEAARLFLRVTDVRVERLQDITEEQARAEGAMPLAFSTDGEDVPDDKRTWQEVGQALWDFIRIWDITIKSADREKYGWDANPWVWVIEYERISREEALANG